MLRHRRHPDLRAPIGAPLVVALFAACSSEGPMAPPPPPPPPADPTVEVFASGLLAPQGIEVDGAGTVWVAEQGTGAADSRISAITPDGQVHPFLVGLASNIVQGSPEGVHHVQIRNGVLWAAQGLGEMSPEGNLLRVDLAGWSPGDPPLGLGDADVEPVGAFVLAHAFAADTDQTNIYNMAFAPDGDLYLTDASANAILRRDAGTGALSVFAELPGIDNPTGMGPPVMQAVPTGIVHDGSRFLVTAFPGFPFPAEHSRVFEVDDAGSVSLFQNGLTSAVDMAFGPDGDVYVVEFGRFGQGFEPATGRVVRLTAGEMEVVLEGLDFPAGIAFESADVFYLSSFGAGEVLRVELP